MNSLVLWHCSTVKIDSFFIPYGGLHFGSYESALCAGQRKGKLLYLHECSVPIGISVPVFDVGNADAWEEEMRFSSNEGDTLIYNNKYEPSNSPSYVVMKPDFLKNISILRVLYVK